MLNHATLPEQLWFALRKAATIAERRAESVVSNEVGVTLGLYMVLSVPHAHDGPVSQQAIADRLGLTKGTVSKLLDGARRDGLVVTAPSTVSRRERAITLTSQGRAIVDAADSALLRSELASFAEREPVVAAEMVEGLYALIASMEDAS